MTRSRSRRYTPPSQRVAVSLSAGMSIGDHLGAHLLGMGCCCDWEAEVRRPASNGVLPVRVLHDDWCPLLLQLESENN
jgi:hypothetical protein